jgi:hypothetical protein
MEGMLVADDAFSPNPGNKSPQGPFGVCPSTNGPWTASNPYYGCDSQGECGEHLLFTESWRKALDVMGSGVRALRPSSATL